MTSGSGSGQRHAPAYCQKECYCLKEAKFACLLQQNMMTTVTKWACGLYQPMQIPKYQIVKLCDMTMTLCQANHTFSAQRFNFEKKTELRNKQIADNNQAMEWQIYITDGLLSNLNTQSAFYLLNLTFHLTSLLFIPFYHSSPQGQQCYCYSGPPLRCQTSQLGVIINLLDRVLFVLRSSPTC